MKRILPLIALIACLSLFSACGEDTTASGNNGETIVSDSTANTPSSSTTSEVKPAIKGETRMVPAEDPADTVEVPTDGEAVAAADFDRIEVNAVAKLFLIKGDQYDVQLKANDEVKEKLTIKVENGRLLIGVGEGEWKYEMPEIFVTLPTLRRLDFNGAGQVLGKGEFSADKIELNLGGNGNIEITVNTPSLECYLSGNGGCILKGTADKLRVVHGGVGSVVATAVAVKDADVDIQGSASVSLYKPASINAKISGYGNISYYGEPKITEEITGKGELIKIM